MWARLPAAVREMSPRSPPSLFSGRKAGPEGAAEIELSKKDGEPYVVVITWLRTRLSFEILRPVLAVFSL